jgi:hypothetical protein
MAVCPVSSPAHPGGGVRPVDGVAPHDLTVTSLARRLAYSWVEHKNYCSSGSYLKVVGSRLAPTARPPAAYGSPAQASGLATESVGFSGS